MKFTIDDITFLGKNLVRPECILTTKAGNSYVSDFRGGITQIDTLGNCTFFGGQEIDEIGLLQANGICLLPDGSFLAAHLGTDTGGVFRVERNHTISPWLTEVEGQALPPSNFIYLDHQGRFWLTVSTKLQPRAKGYTASNSDGFVVVIDNLGARIVADNIGYTNEVCVTQDGKTLFLNATFTRETLAFDINENNSLVNRRVITKYGAGIYPDGLTMDTEGYLWVVSIVSNSIIRVNPATGEHSLMLQDVDQQHLAWVEDAYLKNEMGRQHLDKVKSQRLQNISSLAFSGPSLSTINLGCLLGDSIAQINSPFTGIAPSHWLFDS